MIGHVWLLFVNVMHLGAGAGAAALALWLYGRSRDRRSVGARAMSGALCLSAVWVLADLMLGTASLFTQGISSFAYLAWLWALYRLFGHDHRDTGESPIRPVAMALTFVELLQLALLGAYVHYAGQDAPLELVWRFSVTFRLLFCVGALVIVHNLYAGASQQARQVLRWPAAAMALLWLYDLNLYTLAYLDNALPTMLAQLRGAVVAAMVVLLTLGSVRQESELRFSPSRSFAFQSFSLLIIGGYLVVMVLVAQGISYVGSDFARSVQVGFVAMASLLALAILPSRKLRGWLRVTLSKHLFQHRYDYRAEWLRFTDTIGRAGPVAAPLHERVVQAVADIADSPSGLLLTPREEGGLGVDARWNWADIDVPAEAMSEAGVRFYVQSQFILDLDDLREGRAEDVPAAAYPDWLMQDESAWALVPLLHYERLVGVVVLSRPAMARRLDWEDFDLLRVVGRQLASYLAEQASQDALGEAQRFDEFNRRIAFVMHDIKNLASQLSLLAANAEKHAEKPEFRDDMILTLRKSTDKLQALIARLGRYGGQGGEGRGEVALHDLLGRVVARFEERHDIIAVEREECTVIADAEALEQALVHLLQNAVDASGEKQPIFVDLRRDGPHMVIEIVDSGSGMSSEFLRSKLFKPFHSSKPGGFGIGAFEARELVRAMGGRLDVESREGIGSRFQVRLPRAEAVGLMKSLRDRTEVA